ncbi:chromosome transmission fidelity protein 18 homolog isoform X2 [Ananas comosus]|uniref:Chromosome transmission fidelity protein 18 homolog isoform X2 n=1 Tax=Ananas comosus TaxID=4615 RepID=A0A6P5GJM0_ANACO|nr:chromosome transmission fidelity protein 18 homolog isoform X2 [Ananas comosus]
MEMDVPGAEELEWLESNALLLPEEGEYDEEEYPPEEGLRADRGDRRPDLSPPNVSGAPRDRPIPCSLPDISRPLITHQPRIDPENHAGRKRLRPDADSGAGCSTALPREEEGGNKRRAMEEESDEDWLRHPLPKDAAAGAAPEADVHVLDAAEEKTISRFAWEIEGECLPVTGPGGERVYAKMTSSAIGVVGSKSAAAKSTSGLLSEPISVLNKRLEEDALAKALQESFGSQDNQTCPAVPAVNEQLWVEKYAPSSFTELLSDEQTNREVLLWLKQWDSCVFGSQIRTTTDDVLSALRRHSSAIHQQKFANNKFFAKNNGASVKSQNLNSSKVGGRETSFSKGINNLWAKKSMVSNSPEQKVLLLCGPPGLGKTTLAHVAAKHCGYRVVEINASDDRSASSIESKILDVVQMNSVMPDSKPKCLVIDEIDGALGDGKGTVDVILKMVAAEKNCNSDKGNVTQGAQNLKAPSKRGHKPTKLSRPVICICNDLYAPALRQLRQVAKVYMFAQPTVTRIVNRLKYICNREGFKTSTIALSALAEYTECDIRSCLNTLQFLHKKKEVLNILEVDSQVIGQKDMSRSILDVWKEVFHKKNMKRGGKALKGRIGQKDMNILHSLISNRGEYELTLDGIHENFLRLSYHDPLMRKTVKCLDILGTSESLLQYVFRTQQMSLQAYQPPLVITMSHLISQVGKPNIEWPKNLQRCRAMLVEKKDLLKAWQNNLSPSISRHQSIQSFVEDIVSPLLHILSSPNLRPVALHLLSEREKDDLAQLVDTMVAYSITYKNSKPEPLEKILRHGTSADASPLFLDPPIDDFVKFKGYQSEHSELSLAMKQVLLHEVEKHRILQDSVSKSLNLATEGSNKNEASTKTYATEVNVMNNPMQTPVDKSCKQKSPFSQRQKTDCTARISSSGMNFKAPVTSNKPSKHSSNFFDRFRKESGMDSKNQIANFQKTATIERDSRPLLFKYNEGFTNAVKRPVKIRDLLL